MPEFSGMRHQDAEVFAKTASWFKVYILVRATNSASLPYIARAGYSAKRLDCKAKTADRNVVIDGRAYETAGLVVSPGAVGPGAFSADKYPKALKAWKAFAPHVTAGVSAPDGRSKQVYFPQGGLYGIQLDQANKHFGCVMFSSSSLISAASYVHGDYDLYAIVTPATAGDTVFVIEKRKGITHARSKELLDVQMFINRGIGRPMVLHGDQEKFEEHSDEDIYVFFPDGRPALTLSGRPAVEAFYATELKGRKTAGPGARLEPAGGSWQRVAR